ncbi:hypothetical protein BS17DRAFT_761155 [Gyrodon lividus]|nr:hypothetical protein BS17DRAFT_761155 [Gyrodon lividus]
MSTRVSLITSVSTALKTWFTRVTWSRMTLSFFLLVLANGVAQTTIQTIQLSVSARGRDLVSGVIDAAGVQRGFVVLQGNAVEICSGIPIVHGTMCNIAYNDSISHGQADLQGGNVTRREFRALPIIKNGGLEAVNVSALDASTLQTTLSVQCAESLTWLESFLRDARSEDVAHIVFQLWLFTLSLVSLIDESIPHLIVVLVAQTLNTGWAGFRLHTDAAAKHTYEQLIVNGACEGVDILGGRWQDQMRCAILGVNGGVLLCMLFLAFKLVKMYSKETFSSVGSSPIVNRVLKWTLWMNVSIQFATFFTMASAAIWYDKRKTDIIPSYSKNILHDAAFFVVAVLLLPWFSLGSHSIRHENRWLFFIFSLLSIVLLVVSGLWFGSALFRYEIEAWGFFAAVTTMADVLLMITCVLAFICRLHFGLGLAHFLTVKKELQDSGFARDMFVHDPNAALPAKELKCKHSIHRSSSEIPKDALSFSSETSTPRASACSLESGVFETWLSASRKFTEGGEDEEKGQIRVLGDRQGRRPVPHPLVLSASPVSSRSSVISMSDDGSTDENEGDRSRGVRGSEGNNP